MKILQLNQNNLLFTPLYVHKLQFICNKLHPSSSSYRQLCEPVFLFSEMSHKIICRTILAIWFKLFHFLVLWQMHWCNRLIKCTWNMFFVTSSWMIIFNDQKKLSLNFKSSCLQMFFKTDVLKNFTMFMGKHLCWSYFLV